jgi:Protein kinase domain
MIPGRGGPGEQPVAAPSAGALRLASEPGPPAIAPPRYPIAWTIAAGPGWTCHQAEDLERGEPIRLRLCSREMAESDGFADRVRRHALLVQEVSHRCPAIAGHRDAGPTSDGGFLVASEAVEGETVQALVARRGALPLDRAIHLTKRIGEAVEAAHNAGLIDGRLSPDRVVVASGGDEVKLLDFGLDRAIGAGTAGEHAGCLAPEITAGGPCSERTDVYGVGVILYLMLTGRLPQQPAGRRSRRAVIASGTRRAGIPRRVAAIVLGALDPAPARRPEDMSVLLNDLSELVGLTAPASWHGRAGAGKRFAGRWLIATGVAGAAAAAAALWILYAGPTLKGGMVQEGAQEPRRDTVVGNPSLPGPSLAPRAPAPPAPDPPATIPASASAGVPGPSPAAALPEPVRPEHSGARQTDPAATAPSPGPAGAQGPRRPAQARAGGVDPAGPAEKAESPRRASREAPPRPAAASRSASADPDRTATGERPAPPARLESTRPVAPTRETTEPRATEDPGAIIDWLLRDRR